MFLDMFNLTDSFFVSSYKIKYDLLHFNQKIHNAL